jgi:hypothetical protein
MGSSKDVFFAPFHVPEVKALGCAENQSLISCKSLVADEVAGEIRGSDPYGNGICSAALRGARVPERKKQTEVNRVGSAVPDHEGHRNYTTVREARKPRGASRTHEGATYI